MSEAASCQNPIILHTVRMHISDERLVEFCRLYKEAFGEEISKEEANIMAQRLVGLYRTLNEIASREVEKEAPEQKAPEAF